MLVIEALGGLPSDYGSPLDCPWRRDAVRELQTIWLEIPVEMVEPVDLEAGRMANWSSKTENG